MRIENRNFVVVGLGKSGAAIARFLAKRGGRVTVTDMNETPPLKPEMEALGVRLELGFHDNETFGAADVVVLSPGVPHTIEPVKQAEARGVTIMGEIELASRFIHEPVIAVTGTNGKTTTTTLLSKMLERSGLSVFTGGNIGTPLITYADMEKKADLLVVELSSFQLDTIHTFKPRVALLLNIEDDHLDRYPDFSHYVSSKGRIFQNQDENDFAVINGIDIDARGAAANAANRKFFFCGRNQGEQGAHITRERITIRCKEFEGITLDLSSVKLMGGHNAENISAAALAALYSGGTLTGIQEAMDLFTGLPHRIEFAGRKGEISFYNDSKATNVDAVKRAVECFDANVILIMGGRDKGGNFSLLGESIKARVKHLVLVGEARELIRKALGSMVSVDMAQTMEEAVTTARLRAEKGDTVLFSPGCASFDMFQSYSERGDVFKQAVVNLEEC